MKTDSDKMVVTTDYFSDYIPAPLNNSVLFIYYIINIIISLVGMFSLPRLSEKLIMWSNGKTILLTIHQYSKLYWAIVIVCGLVNIGITTSNIVVSRIRSQTILCIPAIYI